MIKEMKDQLGTDYHAMIKEMKDQLGTDYHAMTKEEKQKFMQNIIDKMKGKISESGNVNV